MKDSNVLLIAAGAVVLWWLLRPRETAAGATVAAQGAGVAVSAGSGYYSAPVSDDGLGCGGRCGGDLSASQPSAGGGASAPLGRREIAYTLDPNDPALQAPIYAAPVPVTDGATTLERREIAYTLDPNDPELQGVIGPAGAGAVTLGRLVS